MPTWPTPSLDDEVADPLRRADRGRRRVAGPGRSLPAAERRRPQPGPRRSEPRRAADRGAAASAGARLGGRGRTAVARARFASSSPSSRSAAKPAARSSSRRRPRLHRPWAPCSRGWRPCSNRSQAAASQAERQAWEIRFMPIASSQRRRSLNAGPGARSTTTGCGLVRGRACWKDCPRSSRTSRAMPVRNAADPASTNHAPRHDPGALHPPHSSESLTMDRREFFKHTAMAGAGSFLLGGAPAFARSLRPSPNEKVRFACIGVGGKGDSDTNDAGKHGEIVALCDIDANVLDKMGEKVPQGEEVLRLPQDARGAGRQDRRGDRQHARPHPRPGQRDGHAHGQALLLPEAADLVDRGSAADAARSPPRRSSAPRWATRGRPRTASAQGSS